MYANKVKLVLNHGKIFVSEAPYQLKLIINYHHMKKTLIFFFAALLSLQLMAEEKKFNSKINKVTVFQNGAQIFRSAYTNIPKGRTQIVFS